MQLFEKTKKTLFLLFWSILVPVDENSTVKDKFCLYKLFEHHTIFAVDKHSDRENSINIFGNIECRW